MTDDLGGTFGSRLQCFGICTELKDEAGTFSGDVLLSGASRFRKHIRCASRIKTLNASSERTDGTFRSMRSRPRSVSPNKFSITTDVNLGAANGKLDVPHVGIHLPQNKSTWLCSFAHAKRFGQLGRRLPIFRSLHFYLAHHIRISDRTEEFGAASGGDVLLEYVLRR